MDIVVNIVVICRVRATDVFQDAVLVCARDRQLSVVAVIVDLHLGCGRFDQIQGVKGPLRFLQVFGGARYHRVHFGVGRAVTIDLLAIDDDFAKPQRQADRSFFRQHRIIWVVIVRLRHAGNHRIIQVAEPVADQLLNQHRHLFLFYPNVSVLGVLHRRLVEHRGIDQLDRIGQLPQAHLRIFVAIGHDIGFVDSSERQHAGIFQDTGGADRQRCFDALGQDPQIFLDHRRQLTGQKMPGNLRLVRSLGDKLIHPVIGNEFFKHIAADDERPRHFHLDILVLLTQKRLGDHRVHKSDAARLAAHRSGAELDKGVFHVFFGQPFKIEDHAGLISLEVSVEHIENIGADIIDVKNVFRIDKPQLVRHVKLGAGPEPAGKMVVHGMVVQAFRRQVPHDPLQVGDIGCFTDHAAVRVFEDKRTEAVVFQDEGPQFVQQIR